MKMEKAQEQEYSLMLKREYGYTVNHEYWLIF